MTRNYPFGVTLGDEEYDCEFEMDNDGGAKLTKIHGHALIDFDKGEVAQMEEQAAEAWANGGLQEALQDEADERGDFAYNLRAGK